MAVLKSSDQKNLLVAKVVDARKNSFEETIGLRVKRMIVPVIWKSDLIRSIEFVVQYQRAFFKIPIEGLVVDLKTSYFFEKNKEKRWFQLLFRTLKNRIFPQAMISLYPEDAVRDCTTLYTYMFISKFKSIFTFKQGNQIIFRYNDVIDKFYDTESYEVLFRKNFFASYNSNSLSCIVLPQVIKNDLLISFVNYAGEWDFFEENFKKNFLLLLYDFVC